MLISMQASYFLCTSCFPATNLSIIGCNFKGTSKKLNLTDEQEKQIKDLYTDEAFYVFMLGFSYYKDNQYKESIKSFLKAADLDPNNGVNWYWLGCSYHLNLEYEKSINALQDSCMAQ